MSQQSNNEQSSDICIFKTIDDCNNRQSRPFSKFIVNKWKSESSSLKSIISTNSRPIPQPRKGRVKTRALPKIDPLNTDCFNNSTLCNLYSTNGGLIDPVTGYYVDNNLNNSINPDDYLTYSNPEYVTINSEGKIACDGEQGIPRFNYYSGPGWKTSRIHGNKVPLSRPIKHWRRQLLPRQFINSQSGLPYSQLNNSINLDSNIARRGRSNIQIDLFNRPGGYSITTQESLTKIVDSNNQVSCIPIYVNRTKDKLLDNCIELNKQINNDNPLCIQSQALLKTRQGKKLTFNPWSFSSGKGYLQARVKLYEQNNSFVFNKYTKQSDINKNKFLLSTTSLHLNHKLIYYQDSELNNSLNYTKTCFTDCSCLVPVTFKPSNPHYKTNGAVASSNNIRRKSKIAINRNQYNITNSWGVNGKHDSLYTKCYNNRVTPKGSYICNIPAIPTIPISINSDWSFMFAFGVIYPGPASKMTGQIGQPQISPPPPKNYDFLISNSFISNNPIDQSGIDFLIPYTQYSTNMEFIFYNPTENQFDLSRIQINNWDVTNVTSFESAFQGGTKSNKKNQFNQPLDKWNVSNVTNMYVMFYGSKFNQDISGWDMRKVKNTHGMFRHNNDFNQYIGDWSFNSLTDMSEMFQDNTYNRDITKWNTSRVQNMSGLFTRNSEFNQDISIWDVRNVTDMEGMFQDASSFDYPLGNWYLKDNNVKVSNMFNQATEMLKYYPETPEIINNRLEFYPAERDILHKAVLDISNYGPIVNDWNVSKITSMHKIFDNQFSFDKDISQWKVHNVTDMQGMFMGASKFNQNISQWNVKNVTNMQEMFKDADDFNYPLGNWDLCSNLTDVSFMFQNSTKMNKYYPETPEISNNRFVFYPNSNTLLREAINDISSNYIDNSYGPITIWNTSRVNNMDEVFLNHSDFNEDISNWNVYNVNTMQNMFLNDTSFNRDIRGWDVRNVTNMISMFQSAVHFNRDIGIWNVYKVNNMKAMFVNTTFNQDISGWDVRNVTDMTSMFSMTPYNYDLSWNVYKVQNMKFMFSSNSQFNQDITEWDVKNVTDMTLMFDRASSFDYPLGNWDLCSNLTDVSNMFFNATKMLKYYPSTPEISNNRFVFYPDGSNVLRQAINQISGDFSSLKYGPITIWNTSRVKNMKELFMNSSFNKDIGNWDVRKVTNMANMFSGASNFNQDISDWNVSGVRDMSVMFSSTRFNRDISGWDVGNVTAMTAMFVGSTYNYDLSWNVSNVTDMKFMFQNSSFNRDISNWNVSDVANMSYMFYRASSFNQDISQWNVKNVTNMEYMFMDANNFNYPLGKWDLCNNLTNVSGMFLNSTQMLKYYPETPEISNNRFVFYPDGSNVLQQAISDIFGDFSSLKYGPIAAWNVSNVENMRFIFSGANNLNQDIGNWIVNNVTDMEYMFLNNTNFNQDIGNWNVNKVRNMSFMFAMANNFNQDIGNWIVNNVTDMRSMFVGASKFNQDISNWNVNKVRDMSQMFTSSIFNQNIGNWIVNNVTNMNNMFGGATSFNGDIKYWNVASVTSMQNMFNGASSFNQNLGNWIAHMRSDVILTDIFTNAQAMITRFGDQILTISHSNWETVFTEP